MMNLRNDNRRFPKPESPKHTLAWNGIKWGCRECGSCFMTARTRHEAERVFAMHMAEVQMYRDPHRESNLADD